VYCPNDAKIHGELKCGIAIGVSPLTMELNGRCPKCNQLLYDGSGEPLVSDYQLKDGPAYAHMFANTNIAQMIYDNHEQSIKGELPCVANNSLSSNFSASECISCFFVS
jgi:hypothetical protein